MQTLEVIAKQKAYIKRLEDALNDFVTEYCDREGDEDYPVSVEDQTDELVKQAMIVLSSN